MYIMKMNIHLEICLKLTFNSVIQLFVFLSEH